VDLPGKSLCQQEFTHSGRRKTEAAVKAGDQLDVVIHLRALIGFIISENSLGLGNPLGIKSGTMKITSDQNGHHLPI
jgi:hypothetical protein